MSEPGLDWLEAAYKVRNETQYSHQLNEGQQQYNKLTYNLEKAIEAGNTTAMLELAGILRDQVESGFANNDERSMQRADALVRKAATLGNHVAMILLGNLLEQDGQLFLAQDWYYQAALQGSADACIALSILETGWQDHEKASVWTALAMNGVSSDLPPKTSPDEFAKPEPAFQQVEIEDDEQADDQFFGGQPDGSPEPRMVRNYREAEALARDWLIYFGFADAEVTPDGADGGIDVDAEDAIAQVKFQALPVGRPVVQALLGVSSHQHKTPFFFASSGYTSSAITFADEVGIALFMFTLDGGLVSVTEAAAEFWQNAE